MVLCCDWIVHKATLRKTPSLPPGYNFWPLKLLGTGKAITKQFTPVFRTKKRTKEPAEGNQRKATTEENKRKRPKKASTKVVKRLCKVERE
ncbi:polysaccharide biosynthesis domain containing 1 [Phyllostomus discolor]|uniref:Polysaccharide biosynthesis domain containing 1 n=1 Tax=Phyllostomus discolor TaxID=89673 RepID=A0A833ZE65_9CHIR|nr:polysaccharide biosynthesis domain containing 1 [Phyllostomus discolor]